MSPTTKKSLELVEHYSAQKEYHPLLREKFDTPDLQEKFWASLNHEIQLVSERSQELEDHEINLYQKTFKTLHSLGRLVPTANVYVELILGIAPTSLEQATSKATISHVLTINRAREIKNIEGSHVKVHVENVGDNDKRAQLLRSLYRVYQEAKDAFEKLPPQSIDATQSARFLRDTAENFISYIQPVETQNESGCFPLSAENQSLLLELRETLEHTSQFVERHCGGKKRVWEQTGAQTNLLNHTRQDPDTNRKKTYASDGSARRYIKRSQNSNQLLLHNSGDTPDAAHPRQQQPSASSRSARRRHPRRRAPKVESSPSRVDTQFIPMRSHQGQGTRLVSHDLYRPADP